MLTKVKLWRHWVIDNLKQLDNVGVLQLAHDTHLAQHIHVSTRVCLTVAKLGLIQYLLATHFDGLRNGAKWMSAHRKTGQGETE